jgi:GNAT superfamily N-acetyltransferase
MLALATDPPVRVRAARESDLGPLAVIRRKSWWAAYHRIIPHDWLRGMNDGRTAQRMASALASSRDRILVVEDDDHGPLGYAWVGQHRGGVAGHGGEILELYLHPAVQGRGLGRQLLVTGIWWLVDRGMHPVLVWVLAANPARHFYEACGAQPVGQGPVTIGDHTLLRVAYSWRDSLPLPR